IFVLQFVQMMRERRDRYLQFPLDVPNDQPVGMRRQKQLHNQQPRFLPHRGEHVSILRHALRALLRCAAFHISIFAEIWTAVKPKFTLDSLLIPVIMFAVDNYVWECGSLLPLLFFGAGCSAYASLVRPKHLLQNQVFMKCKFVSPFL